MRRGLLGWVLPELVCGCGHPVSAHANLRGRCYTVPIGGPGTLLPCPRECQRVTVGAVSGGR